MFSDHNKYSASQAKTVPITEEESPLPNGNSGPSDSGINMLASIPTSNAKSDDDAALNDEIASGGVPLSDIPPTIRRCLASMGVLHRVTNEHRVSTPGLVCWYIIALVFSGAMSGGMGLILYRVLDSAVIAIAVAILGQLSNITGFVCGRAMVLSPVFHELLRTPETRKEIEQKAREGISGMIVFMAILAIIQLLVAYLPTLADGDLFGDLTRPIIMTAIVMLVPNILAVPFQGALMNIIPLALAQATTKKIRVYLRKVRETMLTSDLEDGASMFERLSVEQARMERWARSMNASFSSINGIVTVMMAAWTFGFLGLAAIAGSASGGGIAGILAMSFVFFVFLCVQVYGFTLASRCWQHEKLHLLNDAKLVPIIKREFCTHFTFENWLDKHEASATRMFNFRITTRRMAQVLGGLGSVVAVAGTLIFQSRVGVVGG